ncbi:MAG: 50S ribosomal protein L13 [Nitrososphaerota archaeon]
MSGKNHYIIDAAGCKVGRLASVVAKLLLSGHRVSIYNAEKAVITGNKKAILEHYHMLRGRKQFKSHKTVTVWYPTQPDKLLRYAIIRMLPRKKYRGRDAARRLSVQVGPAEGSEGSVYEPSDVKLTRPLSRSMRIVRYMTLAELSSHLRGGLG